jgi:uncharacterized repeat protein (TIGR01451 family)
MVAASASAANTAGADLQLSLTVAAQAQVGETVVYLAEVRNAGPEKATTVTLSYQLPAGAQFVQATASQGVCTPRAANAAGASGANAAGQAQCLVGPLEVGDHAQVRIVARMNTAGTQTATASVKSDQADPVAANNQASATTSVATAAGGADLQVALEAPSQVRADGTIRYVARVRNNGPSTATAVRLTDQLPAQVHLVRTSASRGGCVTGAATAAGGTNTAASPSTLTCGLGRLQRGAESRVEIVVRPTAAGSVTNAVSVTSAVPDPSMANNQTQATTAVVAAPAPTPQPPTAAGGADLAVKLTGPGRARGHALIRYVARIQNHGPEAVGAVTISTAVTRSVAKVLTLTTSQGACTPSPAPSGANTATGANAAGANTPPAGLPTVATCAAGALARGASARVVITVRAHLHGRITVRVSASSTVTDPRTRNNTDTVTTRLFGFDATGAGKRQERREHATAAVRNAVRHDRAEKTHGKHGGKGAND